MRQILFKLRICPIGMSDIASPTAYGRINAGTFVEQVIVALCEITMEISSMECGYYMGYVFRPRKDRCFL
jgi:hypothetical protein